MENMKSIDLFNEGDVLIIDATGRTWRLYSFYLRQHSSVFRCLLDENPGANLTLEMRIGNAIQWKFRMTIARHPGGRICRFQYLDPTAEVPITALQNFNGLGGPPPHIKTYDNVFRALYKCDVEFSSESLAEMLVESISLLQAAEELGAEKSVIKIISTHLLRTGQPFWRVVRSLPGPWTDVAIRIQSPIIYREAMIHLVGSWDLDPSSSTRSQLRGYRNGRMIEQIVMQILEHQHEEKRQVECNLLEFFPPVMIHQRVGANGPIPTRVMYSNDIYLWQALSLVRMYLTSNIMNDMNYRAEDGGAEMYRMIARGGAAYLTLDVLESYFDLMHMSDRGKNCLSDALIHVKDSIKPIVAPLLVNNSVVLEEDGLPKEHGYLTYLVIPDEELPWNDMLATDSESNDSDDYLSNNDFMRGSDEADYLNA